MARRLDCVTAALIENGEWTRLGPTHPCGLLPIAAPASTGTSSGVNRGTTSGQATSAPMQAVDVAAVLGRAVADKKQNLQWRTSIVDLMKALDLESSLAARKELARDLNYQGDT